MRCRAEIGMLFLGTLACACGQQRQPTRETPPPTGATAPFREALPPVSDERPMAQRSEAQLMLDSARVSLDRGDRTSAIALLRAASIFFRTQAATPHTAGSDHLVDVSRRLAQLADTLRRGRDVPVERIDRASAYANLAEAERHGALALLAWSTRSRQSACDELLMAADHTERAASDGKVPVPSPLRAVLDSMRVLARTLAPAPGVDVQSLDEPLGELQAELGVLRRRLDRADSSETTAHGRRT